MALKVLKLCFWIGIGILFYFPVNASDFYHHLNTGRDVWQHHTLPYTDTYSFTAFGKSWVAYAWGTGIIYYLLYSTFGHIGISLFTAAIGVGTTWFLLEIAKKSGVSTRMAYASTALIATLLSLRWPTRPEILSPFFISLCISFLIKRNSLTLLFIPVFFVWGLLYGSSVFLGVGLLVLFVLLVSTQKLRDLGIVIACAIAGSLNGYGLSSLFYIFQIPNIAAHTGEWLPLLETINPIRPDLALFYQWQVFSYVVFTIIMLVCGVILLLQLPISPQKWIFLVLALSIAVPYKSVRFINLAPVLCAPLLFFTLGKCSGKLKTLLLLCVALCSVCVATIRFATYSVSPGEEFTKKPMRFLKSKGISGNIMSIQEMGAHISWEMPESKILYDTRDDLYQPTGIFDEVHKLDEGKLSIESFVKKYNISIIIGDMNTGAIYKQLLYSDSWSLVYTTDGYFILVDKRLADEKNISTFMAVDPLRTPAAKPGMLEAAYSELRALESLDPESIENPVRSADAALALGNSDGAKKVLRTLPMPGSFGVRSALETVSTGQLLAHYAIAVMDCPRAKSLIDLAVKKRSHALIFSPETLLPNTTDRSLGQYYQRCENNNDKAKEYYMKFLNSTANPLEKRSVEQLMNAL